MRTSSAAPALLALALLVGTAGCSGGSADDAGTPVAPAPATSSASPAETPTPTSSVDPRAGASPLTFDTLPKDTGWANGNGLGVTGVRTARHSGYDRVVFDLGGTGKPGWRVEYTASPTAEGSGDPVTLKGTVFLMVFLSGIGMPSDTGLEPFGDDSTRVPGTGTKGVAEIAPGGGPFEGAQQAFIGLTGAKRPFRVFALTNPIRVVVDMLRS